MINRRNIITATILIILVLVGSYFTAMFIYQNGKSVINISSSMPNTKITIDGKAINTGNIYIKPGQYLISATKDGYYEYRKTIEVNQITTNLAIALTQKPDSTINVSELSSDEYIKLQGDYPVIDNLPYEDVLYTINYTVFGSKVNGYKIEFTIDSQNATGRRQAIKQLSNLVNNPLDYKINFLNFTSEVR